MGFNFHELDKQFFIFLNSEHFDVLDQIMFPIRNYLFWIPLLAVCIYVFLDYRRRDAIPHGLIKVLMLYMLIFFQLILCEYILPYLLGPFARMDRPAYDPDIISSVDFGDFKFQKRSVIFSSQVCTSAAISFFLMLFTDTPKPMKIALIVWALVISYNRIYIGAQYPSTILLSVALGGSIGWLAYRYYRHLNKSVLII
jgi:undecaprenyl-diphosphatase